MLAGKLLSTIALALAILPLAPAAAHAEPKVRQVLGIRAPLQPGEYLWDPQMAPAGKVEIVVDLEAERLYVYRDGVEIGRTLIIYGNPDKPTPTGEFTVLQKDRDHISNLYDAPMPYMLRLTWGGISIHGSGDEVDDRWATHGCIGVPTEFAALIFAITPKGTPVTVTRRWMPEVYGS